MYQTVLDTFRHFLFAGDSDTKPRRLQRAMDRAALLIHDKCAIQTETDLNIVRQGLRHALDHLPGPITVQKLSNIDEITIKNDVMDTYTALLTAVVRVLLPQWPVCKEEIIKLFTIEESFELSHEILSVICGFLRNESHIVTLKALSDILLRYIKSDVIFTAIVDCSNRIIDSEDGKNAKYEQENEWESYVQLLATLPVRVANRLKIDTPKCFSHENYSYYIIFHIIRVMDFMTDSNFYQGTQYDMKCLSHLLSKIITNYYMSGNSPAISSFVDILAAWTDSPEHNKFRKRKLMQALLKHLSRQCIEYLSVILLRRCPIYYKADEQIIFHIIGDNFDENNDWKEILFYKIPFSVKGRNFSETTLQENLLFYISYTKNSESNMNDLIMRLSSVWADVKVTNTSNYIEHMYISQLLILAVRYRVTMSLWTKSVWKTSELKNILFKGMGKHLDILSPEFRAIGMATVEIILRIISEIEKRNKKLDLKFDFDDMEESCKEIYNNLNCLSHRCLIDHRRKEPDHFVPVYLNLKKLLDNMAHKFAEEENPRVHNTMVTCAVKGPEQTKEIVKTIISVKLDALDGKQEDLDSDDDLVPYDMSNDVPVNVRKQPKYLRDLIEMLVEAKDAEVFEAVVEVAEDLLEKQLENEDPKLVRELLDVLVHLEDKYHVNNFQNIKFQTCVTILCHQPIVSVEHLCKEIHTDVGRYSIATKIFMLDVIAEAANRIARVNPNRDEPKAEILCEDLTDVPPEEIIRRRLVDKTRYFHTIRQHPFAKAEKNRFVLVADGFFYPLLGGFGQKQLTLSHHNLKQDIDNILLIKYLSVLGNIVLASKNIPQCSRYCWEIIRIVLYMRYTPEPKIQSAVISLIASIVLVLPASILKTEFFDVMMELRSWLTDCLSNIDLTMRVSGAKPEAAIFAGQVLGLIEKTLAESD